MRQIPLRGACRFKIQASRAAIYAVALLASIIIPGCTRGHSNDSQQDASGSSDYYLLALSWAPNFCATHTGNATECGTGRDVAFVVHGLWPQNEQGRLDQPCQHTAPVAEEFVRYALNFYPSAGLVQHEWQCHGIYSGLSARDYFHTVGQAYQSLHIPASIADISQDTRKIRRRSRPAVREGQLCSPRVVRKLLS